MNKFNFKFKKYLVVLIAGLLSLLTAFNIVGCSAINKTTNSKNTSTSISSTKENDTKNNDSSKNDNSSSKKEDTKNNKSNIDENGEYTTKDDVALYIHTFNKLPKNFITKKEAQSLGWKGGSLEKFAKGKSIGGDVFGNYEKILPTGKYHECDIDTKGANSRGAKRIVFSDDGKIYYTEDHYKTFTPLYE